MNCKRQRIRTPTDSRESISNLGMNKVPPTTLLPGQLVKEVKLTQVIFYLFLPSSFTSSANSVTLYYDAFEPAHEGKSFSLHMFKPYQSIFMHFCGNGAKP